MKTLTVDYTIDGRRRTAAATDRELILLAGDEAKSPAATLQSRSRRPVYASRPGPMGASKQTRPLCTTIRASPTLSRNPDAGRSLGHKSTAIEVTDLPDPTRPAGTVGRAFSQRLGRAGEDFARSAHVLESTHRPGVKYFSGTATYRKTFDLPANWLKWGPTIGRPSDIRRP